MSGQNSIPPRSNVAITLRQLKELGIQTMADVARAVNEGKLKIEDPNDGHSN